jgi:MFS family permease
MKQKSKFVTFILSVVPGLSHLYVGIMDRAVIFFMLFAGILFGSLGLSLIADDGDFMLLFLIGYPILWLVALVDIFSILKKIKLNQLYNNGEIDYEALDPKLNKKTITLSLSIIPGAGHMYLGYQKKGLMIMGTFLLSVFFMGWLGISLLLFLLPLIWFYSFFDAMHIVDGNKDESIDEEFKLPDIKHEWIAYGLIIMGLMIIIERILFPMINPQMRSYIQTSIISLIFIISGVVILRKNNNKDTNGIEKKDEENED